MKNYSFIQENSHLSKIWTLIISIFFSAFFYSLLNSLPYVSALIDFLTENISNATVWGLFFAHLIGGIFFVPSPDEIIFYYGLVKGNPYFLAFLSAVIGYMIAQVVNYYIGNKISPLVMHIISKRKVYKARRFVNRHGTFGIFLFNFLPFPAPLLTFALGIAKYNFTRLFTITLIGKMCKYIVLIIFYFIFSA